MNESYTDFHFLQPGLEVFPLGEKDKYPDEGEKVMGALNRFNFWSEDSPIGQEGDQNFAYMDLREHDGVLDRFAYVINRRKMENGRIDYLRIGVSTDISKENFKTVVIRCKFFTESRENVISVLEQLMSLGVKSAIILEDASNDREIPKRKRTLHTAGFSEDIKIFTDTALFAWGGRVEGEQKTQAEDLILSMQREPVIPQNLRENELAIQLPEGEIAYIYADQPDTAILIDRKTWRPVVRNKKFVTYRIPENKGRRFAGIIVATPPLTPESNLALLFQKVSLLLQRDIEKDETGVIDSQNLGSLFVVEQRGEDNRKGWRQKMLRDACKRTVTKFEHGKEENTITNITVDNTHPDFIITAGRLAKERSAINLFETQNGAYYALQLARLPNVYRKLGYSIDTKSLKREACATKNVPRTLGNLADGNNVTFLDLECGKCTWHRDRNGVTTRTLLCDSPGHESKAPPPPIPEQQPLKIQSEILEDVRCPDCSSHARRNSYMTGYNKEEDEIDVKVETFCPKPGCRGTLANEKRVLDSNTFSNMYSSTIESDLTSDLRPSNQFASKTVGVKETKEFKGPICGDYPEHGHMIWSKRNNMFFCRFCRG